MESGAAFAAGSVVVVRDEEWIVLSCEPAGKGWKVSCVGSSELVASVPGTFYSELDDIAALDPADAQLVQDDSPYFRRSRLWVEAVLRKTPVPLHDQRLTVSPHMLLDPLDFQRQAVAQALDPARLRPRLLIADAVGLGKTLEIGMILAELARRGRAQRVLVVTPRHVLEQMQYELWTRFALPLVRLDSDGIRRVRQQLPASRNPFTFFPKVIVSIDTLKSARYRAHLERHRWDVVVIDESHNLTNAGTRNNQLARVLAPHTETLAHRSVCAAFGAQPVEDGAGVSVAAERDPEQGEVGGGGGAAGVAVAEGLAVAVWGQRYRGRFGCARRGQG